MIKVQNLSFKYSKSDFPILRRVNFEIPTGELVLVSGATGSGKSSLLKCLNGLIPQFSGGEISGKIALNSVQALGRPAHDLAETVGYVNQQPEGSFACDTVEEELAFGLEQLGWAQKAMRDRVQEIAKQFEITDLLARPLLELSGGQQQRVAMASAMAAGQKILLLDEPTSALDQTTTKMVLNLLKTLVKEHGVTVLLAEHRIERVLPFVDSVLVVEGDGSVNHIKAKEFSSAPAPKRPLRVSGEIGAVAFEAIGLQRDYGKISALAPIDLRLRAGSVTAVVGDNGAGKSTLLWCALEEALRQNFMVKMVPQHASDLLFLSTLSEELAESDSYNQLPKLTTSNLFASLAGRADPATHPRDLSAGQQLALVLSIQLCSKAKFIILDEPTRGLDEKTKSKLAEMIFELRQAGHIILLATHDRAFVAATADYALYLDKGVSSGIEALNEA
jgi:energy-coupling factor transport system ATP-binding protein